MSADTNIVVLIGRVTRDAVVPERGPTKFSIAVNRRIKRGDAWAEEASFFDIVYWHKSIVPHLVKGKLISVSGNLKQDRWEQDGQPRSKVVVEAQEIQLLGTGTAQAQAEDSESEPQYEDDIPF